MTEGDPAQLTNLAQLASSGIFGFKEGTQEGGPSTAKRQPICSCFGFQGSCKEGCVQLPATTLPIV